MLVLAGPGSGKTRVITHRIAYLVATGVRPENILALTFTNKAAQEMRTRVIDLVGPGNITICTFHSLCARLLREFAGELSLARNFSIFDRADSLAALREATVRADLDPKSWPPSVSCEVISRAKGNLLSPADYHEQAGDFFTQRVAKIYRGYQSILKENQALDFDDLLVRMVGALRENQPIRSHLAERYRHLLVDEYQDTNRAQYVIARVLCRDHQNICATGDPDQSIYGWRGADISNILDFERDFPEARIVRLEQNYRSTKTILAAADGLIRANKQRRHKELWTENPPGEPVGIVACPDDRAEADYIAQRIVAHVADGGNYSDVAVFYRVNSLSRLLEQTLRAAGIPYQMVRGVAFYSRKEIKDVLAYLRVLVNPEDSLSLLRIINTPARRIGARTVKILANYARDAGCSLRQALTQLEHIGDLSRAAGPLKKFTELLDELSAGPTRPVRDVLENVIRRSGLEAEFAGDRHADGTAMDNVNELISSAAQYDLDNPEGDLEDYLQQTALISDVDSFDSDAGAVAMMTMHAAKGLEFPIVFMVGLEDGLLPHSRSTENQAEMEEERRLCFVGMTRAKQQLFMSYARYRQLRGVTLRTIASPFLAELPVDAVRLEKIDSDAESGFTASRPCPSAEVFSRAARKRSAAGGANRRRHRVELIASLSEGSAVFHRRFGLGTIQHIERAGKFTRALIDFEDGSSQTMMLEYADLHKADDDLTDC